jgi:hypothetical protein
MKEFDWDEAATKSSKPMLEFLKEVQNKPLSEDEFVELFQQVPAKSPMHGKRSPSRGRHKYRSLKSKFGFFGGAE